MYKNTSENIITFEILIILRDKIEKKDFNKYN